MECNYCGGCCIKKGFQSNGSQKFQCVSCKKYQQKTYTYKACERPVNKLIRNMIVRSSGIIDIATVLEISPTTVLKRVRELATEIKKPELCEKNQCYQADELSTKLITPEQTRDIYVSYVINQRTSNVVDFRIGSRNKEMLGGLLSNVLKQEPKRIYTDKWVSYFPIIPKEIHRTTKHLINRIERMHLTLRTRIKRLSRNFMCHSRSIFILECVLKIYFWS